jgi:hypothetical protein
MTRESDEPEVPSGVHHWLTKLDQEMGGLRTGLTDLTHDVNELRVMQAQYAASAGRPSYGTIIALAGVFVALLLQTGAGMYWGGALKQQVDRLSGDYATVRELIDLHVSTAGPFRAGVQQWQEDQRRCSERVSTLEMKAQKNELRIENIEKRNSIADKNWDVMRNRGLLVEQTK